MAGALPPEGLTDEHEQNAKLSVLEGGKEVVDHLVGNLGPG